jgi:putative redox protein
VALGGCSGVDVVSILKKRRQEVTGLDIELTAEQDPNPPWTYRRINVHYTVRGFGLSERAVERAIDLSEKKYCSVHTTVSGVAEVSSSFTIVDDG